MNLYNDADYESEAGFLSDASEGNIEEINHRKKFRKMLEDKLEKKCLMAELEEFDELDAEFNWEKI